MASRPIQRNNVIAGAFLIGSLVLTVILSFVLSDAAKKFGAFTTYTIRFDVEEGVPGVKIDSPVLLGGLDVGRVTAITTIFDTTDDGVEIPVALDVSVDVDDRVVLFSNARAYVVLPILGTMSSINIADAGGPRPGPDGRIATILGPTDPLEGDIAPAILAQAGLGPEESQLIREMLADARDGVGTFRQLADTLQPVVETGVGEVEAALQSFRRTADRIDVRSEQISENVVEIIDDVRGFSARLEPTMADVQAGVDDARAIIASVQQSVDENRPLIRRSVESVQRTTERVETQTLDKVESVLDEGLIAASNFSDTGARAESLLAESAPNLRRAIANLRLISDQTNLFVQEVRAAPWRLLERPKTKELKEQLLYDATRAYATAVTDLRSASESLDAALAALADGNPASAEIDAEALTALTGQVRRAFGEYRQAETLLLELVTDGALSE
jgi:ABC-type transporter Mla subunit MlaD